MESPPKPPQSPAAHTFDESAKDALALQALGLLNEQVKARIVHYRGDLATNQELDAVTAQVVQQLKEMQAAVARDEPRQSPEEMERQQIELMADLLTKILRRDGRSSFVASALKPIGRRVAKLFFESELHEKTKGNKERRIHHPEQGIYYVLQRYKNRLRAELEGFEYDDDAVKKQTLELLTKTERDMQVAFLSRRSPELNRVMKIYTQVVTDFLQQHLSGSDTSGNTRIKQMAYVTIRNAKTARQANSVGYKVQADVFPGFRREWERLLMQQMVNYCSDNLLEKLEQDDEHYRDETVKFFTDPHIFSATCEVLCDALYDYLCLEGFLDLPMDWRIKLGRDQG